MRPQGEHSPRPRINDYRGLDLVHGWPLDKAESRKS